jgi:hypothetical protein
MVRFGLEDTAAPVDFGRGDDCRHMVPSLTLTPSRKAFNGRGCLVEGTVKPQEHVVSAERADYDMRNLPAQAAYGAGDVGPLWTNREVVDLAVKAKASTAQFCSIHLCKVLQLPHDSSWFFL